MSKLMINDLVASQDLDSKAMASVYGGSLLDVDNLVDNLVNEATLAQVQSFDIDVPQSVVGQNAVTSQGGNGATTITPINLGANFFGGFGALGNGAIDQENDN